MHTLDTLQVEDRKNLEDKYRERVHSAGQVQDVELERFYNDNPNVLEEQILLG
jgi:hypothetical protein